MKTMKTVKKLQNYIHIYI